MDFSPFFGSLRQSRDRKQGFVLGCLEALSGLQSFGTAPPLYLWISNCRLSRNWQCNTAEPSESIACNSLPWLQVRWFIWKSHSPFQGYRGSGDNPLSLLLLHCGSETQWAIILGRTQRNFLCHCGFNGDWGASAYSGRWLLLDYLLWRSQVKYFLAPKTELFGQTIGRIGSIEQKVSSLSLSLLAWKARYISYWHFLLVLGNTILRAHFTFFPVHGNLLSRYYWIVSQPIDGYLRPVWVYTAIENPLHIFFGGREK